MSYFNNEEERSNSDVNSRLAVISPLEANFSDIGSTVRGMLLLYLSLGVGLLVGNLDLNAEESAGSVERTGKRFSRVSGGYINQGRSDVEAGGEFRVESFISQASIGYRSDSSKEFSVGVGFRRDAYDFGGFSGFSATNPWGNIDILSLAASTRWAFADDWSLLGIPMIRVMAEDGADWSDSVSGGGLVGFSYRVNDRLTIGPGFGALTQIEDRLSVFPFIIVDWKINDRLKLETGRGLGASQGPGLLLSYSLNPSWSLLAGGRLERLRFRLSRQGPVPNGVGEDRGAPLSFGARYSWMRKGSVTVFGGFDVAGELLVDNPGGRELSSSSYDPAPFFGVSANLRF
ncbi:hypothetical protein N8766_00195 [bacterium]|nr:hypothetical protein [bacterium]